MEKATPKRTPAELAIWLLAIGVVTAVATWFGWQPERARSAWVFAILGIPTVCLAALAGFRVGDLRSWLAPSWGDLTRGFGCGVVLFLGAVFASKLLFPTDSPRELWLEELYSRFGSPVDLMPKAPRIALVICAVAVAEEVLWRGVVTRLLAEYTSARWAWVSSAALYALVQVPSMLALEVGSSLNPVLPFAALACGLAWGAMANYFGRLAPSIIAHALFDWTVLMMFPLYTPAAS